MKIDGLDQTHPTHVDGAPDISKVFLPKSFVGVERLSYVLKSLSKAFNAVNSSRVSLLGGRANLKKEKKCIFQ